MTDPQTFSFGPSRERSQRTLRSEVSFSGIGIHTGEMVTMKFVPAPPSTGIVFKRIDLPGSPVIPARVEYVVDTSRSTILGIGPVKLHTVEHVLSAVRAYQIDNLIIEITNIEPPVANGSSDVFVEMIESVGIEEQDAKSALFSIKEPIYYSDSEIHLVALPYPGYKISYTLNYPDNPAMQAQFFSSDITSEVFKKQIAPCRTFSRYNEVEFLIDRGLIKGASLDNAVVIKDDVVFSKGGLFFQDEMARHKVLDMIGDLFLVGHEFNAHIIAIRSGHAANVAFAKKILTAITPEIAYEHA